MATKKVAPKKAAKPVKKAPVRPVAKAPVKASATKKPAPPAKKQTPMKNAGKASAKGAKAPQKMVKPVSKAATKAVPKKQEVKKQLPKAIAEPVKKPVVTAHSQQTTKTATKPLESKAAAKEPAKPAKLVIPKTSTDKKIKYEPDFTRSVLDSSQKHEENGPTMRYSDAELIEFRELINKKLDVAKKELAYLQGLITRKDESGDLDEGRYMTMEDGSMSMEREQLSQMASRQIQFTDHLEKAIMRIENKTYGICRVTGKLIDKARLRAVPHATLSIEAKQMMNK